MDTSEMHLADRVEHGERESRKDHDGDGGAVLVELLKMQLVGREGNPARGRR